MTKDDTGVLIGYFDNKFTQLLDDIDASIDKKVRVIVQEELEPVKADIKIIKAAVTATNIDVQDLKLRVTALEAA